MNATDPISWPDLIQAAWPLWFALGVTFIVGTAGHWNRVVDRTTWSVSRMKCRVFGHAWTQWYPMTPTDQLRLCRRVACHGDKSAEQWRFCRAGGGVK